MSWGQSVVLWEGRGGPGKASGVGTMSNCPLGVGVGDKEDWETLPLLLILTQEAAFQHMIL